MASNIVLNSAADLIALATNDLGNQHLTAGTSFAMPENPAVVLFYGRRFANDGPSAAFMRSIDHTLASGWGGSMEYLPRVMLTEPAAQGAVSMMDMNSGRPMSATDFQQAVARMKDPDLVADARCTMLFCVVDTRGMSADEFRAWYLSLPAITSMMEGAKTMTMLMVACDGTAGSGNAHEIITAITDLYDDDDPQTGGAEHHLYDSVFCFGNTNAAGFTNRLYDDDDSSVTTERDVFADVMLLANTHADELNETRAAFYGLHGSSSPIVTASFRHEGRPLREIALTVARALIVGIAGRTSQETPLGVEEIKDALSGIVANGTEYGPFVDEVIREYDGFAAYLPSQGSGQRFGSMTYAQADAASFGCLSAFVNDNHIRDLDDRIRAASSNGDNQMMRGFIDAFPASRVSLTKEAELQTVLDGMLSSLGDETAISESLPINSVLLGKLRAHAVTHMRGQIGSMGRTLSEQARATVSAFNELDRDLAGISVSKKDLASIQAFYGGHHGGIVQRYLATSGKLDELCGKVLRIGNTKQDIMRILYKEAIQPLFASEDAFRLDFMEERIRRFAASGSTAHAVSVVAGKLMDPLTNSNAIGMSLRGTMPTCALEAYMLHHDRTAGTAANGLWEELGTSKGTAPRTLFDISGDDDAVSVWVFPLSAGYL